MSSHLLSNKIDVDCSANRQNSNQQSFKLDSGTNQRIGPKPIRQHHALAVGIVLVVFGI